jgi:xanthine dioxygenase
MDGPLYKANPPMISSFRIIKFPVGEQEVDWADGSGLKKKVPAGRTAFFSTAQLYNLFSEDEKKMVNHSWVEYMFYPYEWIRGCRGNPNGLGVACEDREVSDVELAEHCANRDPSWTQVVRVPLTFH